MNEYLFKFFENNNLDIKNKKLTLAISTGVDSMALLFSFIELQKIIPFEIIVCHVNHNKRVESVIEEEYIKDFCFKNNIKCYVEKLNFESSSNFQAVARNLRYQFFYEVMDKEDSEYLFLAHHGDDLVETILMRILRGSSLNGYSGIKKVSNFDNRIIVRPFLELEKDDLINYQKEKGFKYFEDSSNSEEVYTRNKLRHKVIPGLKEIDENIVKKFNEFSYNLDEAADTLMKEVEKFVSEKVIINDSETCFYLDDYLLLSEYMQKEVLFYLLKEEKLSLKNIEEINKWIFSEKKNIKNSYKGIEFLKEYNKISFKKEKQEKLDVNIEITSLGRYKVNDTISINVIEKKDNIVTNLNELCYNIQRLPIYIRTRKNGDKILLKNGYKKVKDLLIDEKIGVSKRDNILLAVDNEGNVLSVLGIKKSEILKQIKDNNIIIKVEESYE